MLTPMKSSEQQLLLIRKGLCPNCEQRIVMREILNMQEHHETKLCQKCLCLMDKAERENYRFKGTQHFFSDAFHNREEMTKI